ETVADKADFATFFLQLFDVIGLIGGQHLGEVAVHPELLGELAGRGLVIARDDRYLPDAARSKTMNNAAHPGPYQRPQFNRAADLVVDGDHRHRMAFAMHFVERRFDLTRQRHTFHFHKPTAANAHPAHIAAAIGDADSDAVADFVLGLVGARQTQTPLV